MNKCEHCGYRFPTPADLAEHERGGCPDAP